MKYIFTVIGAIVGLIALHGFVGLLIGAGVGLFVDGQWHRFQRQRRARNRNYVEPLFALLGAVAKSDGRVSKDEIAVAERMMRQQGLDKAWRERAIAAFQRGKQPDFDIDSAIRKLRDWTGGYRDLAYPMLDVLVDTVLAEGQPSQAKMEMLQHLAQALHISNLQLMAMLAMKARSHPGARPGGWAGPGSAGAGGRQASAPRSGFSDPYAVLGLKQDADDATVKRTYRKLMSEHHPDRLGDLPDDLKQRAAERASSINAAYDQIKEQRGLK